MNQLSIHFAHDTTFAFSPGNGIYRSYELERLTKKRYDAIDFKDMFQSKYDTHESEKVIKYLRDTLIKEFGDNAVKIDKFYYDQLIPDVNGGDLSSFSDNFKIHDHIFELLEKYFEMPEKRIQTSHHRNHAYGAFFQSPFDEAIIITIDGGGINSEDRNEYFNIHYINRYGDYIDLFRGDLTICCHYDALPWACSEIKGHVNASAGKIMGLTAYKGFNAHLYLDLEKHFASKPEIDRVLVDNGKQGGFVIDEDIVPLLRKHLVSTTNPNFPQYFSLDFWEGASLAQTVQVLFENTFIKFVEPFIEKYNLPIVISGGGALNVLNNSRIKNRYKLPVYIPCNPNDTGTAIGPIFEHDNPKEQIDLRFSNWDLFDREDLPKYVKERNGELFYLDELAKLLREGKIIGVVKGRSECGPRALGNRSIICDPSVPNIKDLINAKVKGREWWRPFAPMVQQDKSDIYFNWDNSPATNMSFSAITKAKYRNDLKAITHWDGTARIQTVSLEDNPWYYNLLEEMNLTGLPVLLNTSFNIQGKPILNSIEDAFYVLDNTELDYVIIEDYIFKKK